jgi:hypothetical protein
MRLNTARTPASMQGPSQVEGESASDWPPVLAARSMPMSQAKVHPAGWLARSPRPSLHPVQLGCAETQHSPAPQTISSPLQRRAQSLRAAPEQAQRRSRQRGGRAGMGAWTMLAAALGRARRVPRTGFTRLTTKQGPRGYYKGKGAAPTGQHTSLGRCACRSSSAAMLQ